MEQGCDLLGVSKKGKDASPQMAMFSRLGDLAPLKWYSLSLSLSKPLLQSMYQGSPSPCTHLLFLLLAWAAFPGYGNICFTLLVHCWAIPLERWKCLVYFPALCGCIVHDVCICIYIYIYIYACMCVGGCALYMTNFCGYMSDLLQS